MHIVKKDFKGSPDGYTVIDYPAGPDPVEIPSTLVEMAMAEGWIEPYMLPAPKADDPDLNPLVALVKKPVADIVAALPTLVAADLEQLLVLDAEDGRARKTLSEAIADEQAKRIAAVQTSTPANDNPDPAANE